LGEQIQLVVCASTLVPGRQTFQCFQCPDFKTETVIT